MEFEYIKRIVKYSNEDEEVIIYWKNGKIEKSYMSKEDLNNIEIYNKELKEEEEKRIRLIRELKDLVKDLENMDIDSYNWNLGNIDEWLEEIRGKI